MPAYRTIPFVLSAVIGLFATDAACDAALARAAGQPARYTGRLSSNKAIRKQQLIVDPEGIASGSASVLYDPEVVSLSEVLDPADFAVTGGFIGLRPRFGSLTTLTPLSIFFERINEPETRAAVTETGFVQVFFDRRDTGTRAIGNSSIPNLPGYTTVDEDGPTGVGDTHALIFDYLATGPNAKLGTYKIFATAPIQGTTPDQLTSLDDPENPVPYREILPAFVEGGLGPDVGGGANAVPLPPAAATGLAMLAGMALLGAWKRNGRGFRPVN